jgi:trehalose 6-phosphate phosphatase
MVSEPVKAIILDLDGVITRTASLHAKAWKQVFDEYQEQRKHQDEPQYEPFSVEKDYRDFVDGKPRYEGVRSFLESRGIKMQEGSPSDEPGWTSICAIGNRKNEIFHQLLGREGAEVFPDAVDKIREWHKKGYKTAVVSSSKNCIPILQSLHLESLFDVSVDGVIAEKLKLHGKPSPDIFLQASKVLDIRPHQALLMEDAQAGVQAGKSGDFGLVIGVARDNQKKALQKHGADVTIRSFRDIEISNSGKYRIHPSGLPSALDRIEAIVAKMAKESFPVFLDYDGTLTPIVNQPEDAVLPDGMRCILKRLAASRPTAIVSGRDLSAVKNFVRLNDLIYAGSHGFDIEMLDGSRVQFDAAKAVLPELNRAEEELNVLIKSVEGARIERKRFAVAVHFRNVSREDVPRIEPAVNRILSRHDSLRISHGKKVLELRPDIDWNKGKAVIWLYNRMMPNQSDTIPLYIGDDITDEDAFLALQGWGIGILVGNHGDLTAATFQLKNVKETAKFLERLIRE